MTKTCSTCKQEKPLSEYRSRGGSLKHLLKSRCNQCLYLDHKRWVENNPDKVKEYRAKDKWTLLKRCQRHDITPAEFWFIYEEQDSLCPICCEAIVPEDSAIDHNHETGEVRGILCKKCNRALGLFGDDPSRLKRAIKYLKQKGHYAGYKG